MALSFFIRRDFLRAALFRWIIPLLAALSSRITACRTASSESARPLRMASSAFRIIVFTNDRYITLRIRFRSFERTRFLADGVFANGLPLLFVAAPNNADIQNPHIIPGRKDLCN